MNSLKIELRSSFDIKDDEWNNLISIIEKRLKNYPNVFVVNGMFCCPKCKDFIPKNSICIFCNKKSILNKNK